MSFSVPWPRSARSPDHCPPARLPWVRRVGGQGLERKACSVRQVNLGLAGDEGGGGEADGPAFEAGGLEPLGYVPVQRLAVRRAHVAARRHPQERLNVLQVTSARPAAEAAFRAPSDRSRRLGAPRTTGRTPSPPIGTIVSSIVPDPSGKLPDCRSGHANDGRNAKGRLLRHSCRPSAQFAHTVVPKPAPCVNHAADLDRLLDRGLLAGQNTARASASVRQKIQKFFERRDHGSRSPGRDRMRCHCTTSSSRGEGLAADRGGRGG